MPSQYHISGRSARAIAESIERAIEAGRFTDGSALPTIRALATKLGVSPTTVSAAFAALRRDGRIIGRRRGGSIVVGRPGLQQARAPQSERGEVGRNLAIADPDPAFFPALRPALFATLREGRLYGTVADSAALADVAKRAFATDGLDASHYGVASGAMDAIERALGALVGPGDVIAIEDPAYPPYVALAQSLGLRVVRVRVDDRGPIPKEVGAAIRACARAFIVVPRAHNPTGVSIDAARAREIARLLRPVPDVAIVEDDFLASICGVPLHSLARGRRRWISVRSLAKALGPDLRVAPFVGDALTVARMRERQRLGPGWVSLVLQEAAAAMLRDPKTRALLGAATRTYGKRRALFLSALARHGITCASPAGFTVWVPVPDEAEAVRAALVAGFRIDGGARYRAASPSAVRVTITTITAAEAETLARALAAVIRSFPITRTY